MSGSAWDPEQYERFRDERSQPFYDLLDMVRPIPGGRAIDLGCGTGELTKVLHTRTGARTTVGLDNSEAMLAKSAAFAGGGLTFRLGTILRFAPGRPFDLVFSNAALQWAPDHARLFPRLAAGIAPGGQLAVQMPANTGHPSHTVADAIAGEAPFAEALGGYVRRAPVEPPEWYAALLDRLGLEEVHVRLQVYLHRLESPADVVEWVRGTYLTDYQARMAPELFGQYVERYRERLRDALGDERPYLYTFRRLLLWARKPG